MNYIKYFPICCLLLIGLVSCRDNSRPELKRLDAVISEHPELIARRSHQIDSVRSAAYRTDFEREMAMQDAMGSFSLDSAIYHARRAVETAKTPGELSSAKLALARHYNTSGVMYKEANELFRSIDRSSIDKAGLTFPYFSLAVQLNRNLATHSLDPELKASYLQAKVAYRDSALTLDPTNEVLLANRYMDSGDYPLAIGLLRNGLDDDSTTRDAAVRFNILAQLYSLQGDESNASKYLALSSICDLSNGTREYLSLQQLAMMLYEAGDYERAYRYIHHSIEDASACNAKLRMLEMSTMLPIIEKAHEDAEASSRRLLYFFIVLIGLLAVALFIAMNAVRHRNRSLSDVNSRQLTLNNRLTESDRIKEEYLTRFMNLCLEYLAQMESYRRELLRIAAHKNFDELCKTIESSRYIGKGINDFLDKFDEAFLNMFPSFIVDLKKLLTPDYSPHLKANERLNTELRIFALIRLGFNDSESICRFLRCSPSTVYNYRARLRSMALNRDSFDKDIMRIGRI